MRLLIDARPQAQLRKAPEPTGMGAGVLRPDFEHNFDRLLGHGYAILEIDAELGELTLTHALADAEIETSARQIIQHGGLSREPEWMMKRHGIDIVAKAHVPGALDGRGDHQIRAREKRIISAVVFGEPAFAEAQRFRQNDLIQHLMIGLIMGHASPLAVVEQSKIHKRLL